MDTFLDGLGAGWNQFLFNLKHMSLGMALWIGMGVLGLGLLILISTRWGHAKPVSKCVALSLLAHVLLGGFAYGTKFIQDLPTIAQGEPIRLKVVDADADSQQTSHDETRTDSLPDPLQPWDRVDEPQDIPVEVKPADRVKAKLDATVTRTAPKLADPSSLGPQNFQQEVPMRAAPRALEQTPTSANPEIQKADDRVARAEEIEVVRQKKAEPETRPVMAQPTSPQRMVFDDPSKKDSTETPFPKPASPPRQAPFQADAEWLDKMATAAKPTNSDVADAFSEAIRNRSNSSDGVPGLEWGERASATPAASQMRLGDGKPMPSLYAKRSDKDREAAAIQFGGSRTTEQAVSQALQWLSQNQEPDGRWQAARFGAGQEEFVLGHDRKGAGRQADTGITALALLAFLANGQSHLEGEHRVVVQKGLEFLLDSQRADGCLAGEAALFAQMYCHAMSTLAVCEAIALTGDERLRPAAEAAVAYSVRAQNPNDGGWRYRPGDYGDMSQFGWQVMALKSAELGGLKIPVETKDRMKKFLDGCAVGNSGGLAGYRRGGVATPTMTAESLLCRHFLLGSVDAGIAEEATSLLLQHLPDRNEINLYYWYYGTLAMFHTGGSRWETWNRQLTRQLLDSQEKSGELVGSWAPEGVWCGYGGRVYSTAMATLCLEVYYRYSLPDPTK